MASIISAGTTSGTALNMSGDTSGTLVLQTSGATALTIDASQNATFAGWINGKVYTVANLPTAGTAGRRAFVSNALTPVVLSTVVGGGAITVPVYDNGTNWIVG